MLFLGSFDLLFVIPSNVVTRGTTRVAKGLGIIQDSIHARSNGLVIKMVRI